MQAPISVRIFSGGGLRSANQRNTSDGWHDGSLATVARRDRKPNGLAIGAYRSLNDTHTIETWLGWIWGDAAGLPRGGSMDQESLRRVNYSGLSWPHLVWFQSDHNL